MTDEDHLINDTWTPLQTETFYYYDDVFERSEVSISQTNKKIDFQKNNIVFYESPDLTEVIQGTWEIDPSGESLLTDIHLALQSSTGHDKVYFFYPESKIIELNTTNLILESMPETFYIATGTSQIKVMSYERQTYVKNEEN